MTAAPLNRWLPSSKQNPCPICGRTADGDCRTGEGLAICHHGGSHHPPAGLRPGDVIEGRDGQRWAFTSETSDGRGSTFTLDKPRHQPGRVVPFRPHTHNHQPAPVRIDGPIELARLQKPSQEPPAHLPHGQRIAYSPTQWVEVIHQGGNKKHLPRHTGANGQTVELAGPEPWPLWREADALEHGPGRWIAEAEGEKCAAWLRAGGLVAMSQPGHDHKPSSIERRYRLLLEAGVAGVLYLADNDPTGERKAKQCAGAAAAVGLPVLVLPAAEVWPGLPAGGSIDDAPGTAAERAAALLAAIPAAVERHQQQQAASAELTPKLNSGTKAYRILGWCPDRSRIHYQHRETGQIASVKPAAQAGSLLQLAPIDWWATFHPTRNGSGIDWAGACSEVIEQANRAGVFAVDRVRGRGLWMDGSRTVWHLGDRLEVDGVEVALIEHRSAHHYPRLPALDIDRSLPPLTDDEGREILEAVAAMGWATPLDPLHLLGWAVLANVGGALDKRPVLQITSRFGSGKTFTRERVLQPLLAGLAISRSNSTEAGIRQLLRADTLPVLIDESEGEDANRREGHLRLARLSYDGSPTDRGTTHGQALSYAIRSSVAMVGINATINNPAERSRTVLVGREQLPQDAWAGVDRRLAELLTATTGARLLRRAVNHLPTLRANVATFRRAVEALVGGGAAARAGDTFGALLAGAHLLTSAALVDDGQALDWLDSINWSAAAALGEAGAEGQSSTAESLQCLQHLLSHEEPWRADNGTGRLSIRELLELARTPSGADDAEQARKALGRRGIRAGDLGLQVANTPEALAPIYSRTKWRDGGHRARLLDLPGAFAAGMVRVPVLGSLRACCVPWEVLG